MISCAQQLLSVNKQFQLFQMSTQIWFIYNTKIRCCYALCLMRTVITDKQQNISQKENTKTRATDLCARIQRRNIRQRNEARKMCVNKR